MTATKVANLFLLKLSTLPPHCIVDVAISAPYEQAGAVYIYLGNIDGITEKYSQKIQPEDFMPQMSVRGFGVSISKGVDVDGNSYNGFSV